MSETPQTVVDAIAANTAAMIDQCSRMRVQQEAHHVDHMRPSFTDADVRRARLDAFAGQAMAAYLFGGVHQEVAVKEAVRAAAALLAARDAQDATGGTR